MTGYLTLKRASNAGRTDGGFQGAVERLTHFRFWTRADVRPRLAKPWLLLLQHQLALLSDHALRRMGEAREQPRQRDFKPHYVLIDIDDAGGTLA